MQQKRKSLVLSVCLVLSLARPMAEVSRIADLSHEPLSEVSGIVKSSTYPDVYWVHNDSGDTARIFAINIHGGVIVPPYLAGRYGELGEEGKHAWPGISILGAFNVDWEDIALAEGRLYISDMGINWNARRDLGIYVVNEPNPRVTSKIRTLKFLPVAYPDQGRWPAEAWHFDCEAITWIDRENLLVANENRGMFRIRIADLGPVREGS